MNDELFERVLVQLHPELAQEFGCAILEDRKKLKALEIIKKLFKGHLNIDYDKNHDFYEIWTSNEYEDMFVIASGHGKEEYELLKEVLL